MSSAEQAARFKARGNEFFKKGDYETAVQWYTKAVNADPQNRVYYSNRAAAYQKMKRYDLAEADGKACINCDPTWNKGYYRLATALESQGKYEELLAVCKKGLNKTYNNETKSGDKNLLDMRDRYQKQAEQQAAKRVSALPQAERLKEQGDKAFKEHKTDDAARLYTRAIDACGSNDLNLKLRIMSNRSEVRKQLREWEGVIEDTSYILEEKEALTFNLLAKALYRRAFALNNIEKFRLAMKDATEVVDMFMRARLMNGTAGQAPTNKLEISAQDLKTKLAQSVKKDRAERSRK